MKLSSDFENIAFQKYHVDIPVLDGGKRDTNRKNPIKGGRGDIKYKKKEYNKTRAEACECGGPNDPGSYGGIDWYV